MAQEENKPISFSKLSDIAGSFLAPVETKRKKAFSAKSVRKMIKALNAPAGDDVKTHMSKDAQEALSAYVETISKVTSTPQEKKEAEARLTGAMRKMKGDLRGYVESESQNGGGISKKTTDELSGIAKNAKEHAKTKEGLESHSLDEVQKLADNLQRLSLQHPEIVRSEKYQEAYNAIDKAKDALKEQRKVTEKKKTNEPKTQQATVAEQSTTPSSNDDDEKESSTERNGRRREEAKKIQEEKEKTERVQTREATQKAEETKQLDQINAEWDQIAADHKAAEITPIKPTRTIQINEPTIEPIKPTRTINIGGPLAGIAGAAVEAAEKTTVKPAEQKQQTREYRGLYQGDLEKHKNRYHSNKKRIEALKELQSAAVDPKEKERISNEIERCTEEQTLYERYAQKRESIANQYREGFENRRKKEELAKQLFSRYEETQQKVLDKDWYLEEIDRIDKLPTSERLKPENEKEKETFRRAVQSAIEAEKRLDREYEEYSKVKQEIDKLYDPQIDLLKQETDLERINPYSKYFEPQTAYREMAEASMSKNASRSVSSIPPGGTVSASGTFQDSGPPSAGNAVDITPEIAQLQQIQQQISNTLAAIQQENNLAGESGRRYEAQLADLRREISKVNVRAPNPVLQNQHQQLSDVQRGLRNARSSAATNPQAIANFQSGLPAVSQRLQLPAPVIPTKTTSQAVIESPVRSAPSTEPNQAQRAAETLSAPLAQAPGESPSFSESASQGIETTRSAPQQAQRPTTGKQFGALASASGFIGVGQKQLGPKPSRTINLPLSQGSIAGAFNASQDQDRRSRDRSNLSGDSQLSETTLGENGGTGSVLDSGSSAPSYAYTDPDVPSPMAGGDTQGGGILPSMGEEAERSRRLSEEKNQTLKVFAPQSFEDSLEEGERAFFNEPEAAGGSPSRASTPMRLPYQQQEDGGDEDQDENEDVNARQQEDRKTQNNEAAAQQQQEQQQAAEKAKEEAKKKMLDYIKGTNAATSFETLAVTLFVNLAFWNVQAINKYGPRSKMIPTQSFCEDFACLTCDISVCINCMFSPPCFIGPTIILFVIVYYLYDKSGVGSVVNWISG
jgi:hypothetical protein